MLTLISSLTVGDSVWIGANVSVLPGVQSEVSRKITSADKGKYSLFKEWKNFCLTFFVKRNIINSKRVAN